MTSASVGWDPVARAFHWTLAALILFQLGLGLRMVFFTADLGRRFDLTQLHKSWGAVIFVLALGRLAWRLAAGRPAPEGPAWRRRLAVGVHGLLYALMLGMPLSGWVQASASPLQDLLGIRNMVFGLVALPDPWIPGSERVEAIAGAAHLWGAALMAGLIGFHVAGALKGELIDRDHTLRRMLRGR